MKSNFKFLASATLNEVGHVGNERLITNDVTSGTSRASCFYFAWLDGRIVSPTSVRLFVLLLSTKTPNHYPNDSGLNLAVFGNS